MQTIEEQQFEDEIEQELIQLGWLTLTNDKFKRDDLRQVIDFVTLENSIIDINSVSLEIAHKAIFSIKKILNENIETAAHKAWELLVEGVKVYDDKQERTLTIKLISNESSKNTYSYIRQLEISDGYKKRIPDIVLYINGLPISVMELKSPIATEKVEEAFLQNKSLVSFSPQLWMFNIINFISNRIITKYGTTFTSFKRFNTIQNWNISNWKTKENISPISYLYDKTRILKFITSYSFYANEKNTNIKYILAQHQIRAVENTIETLKISGDNRGGVVWHTQGSGKSVTMLALAKRIIEEFNNATIVVVTDRNALDKQLFARFLNAEQYLRNKAIAVETRAELIEKLNNKKHFGIYFSTVQKFTEETDVLSNRDDIFLLVDEAHRSQNNVDGHKMLSKEKEEYITKFGYARYMRDAFPNAKITGFTGTPLMKHDKNTNDVFGDYNDVYSMNDAVQDNATVPIHYEMRKVKFDLDDEWLSVMDEIQREYVKTLPENDIASQQKVEALIKSVRIKHILENDDVINAKCTDMLEHLDKRSKVLHGKAMIVAYNRAAAYKYYQTILRLRPELKESTILVITDSNKDSKEMAEAIVDRQKIAVIEEEFRKDNSKYKIAIVVDMWLTGFDVQDLDVLYIDKIMKWHNLMQAIARVNRTYEEKIENGKIKENGLIVDYIGIWKYLSAALIQYASGQDKLMDLTIEDVHKAKELLLRDIDIINDTYAKNIKKFDTLNTKDQYQFIIKSADFLLAAETKLRNEFILIARNVKRFFKMSYSVIDSKIATISKCVEVINNYITSAHIQIDDNLSQTIDEINEAIKKAIDSNESDVYVSSSKISRDINEVSKILKFEAEQLRNTAPRVAIEMLKNSIKNDIKKLEMMKPIFAKKASDKLRDIINELQKMEDVQKIIDMLRTLNKDITEEMNVPPEFKDPQIQAFFEIISNDDFFKDTENSEVLRQIALDIYETVVKFDTENFNSNVKIKSNIANAVVMLLKTKYNYPPEHVGLKETSGILIDDITKKIKINKDYFRKDD